MRGAILFGPGIADLPVASKRTRVGPGTIVLGRNDRLGGRTYLKETHATRLSAGTDDHLCALA